MRFPNPKDDYPAEAYSLTWRRRNTARRELNAKNLTSIIVIASVAAVALVACVVVTFLKARHRRRVRNKGTSEKRSWSLFHILSRDRAHQPRYEQASRDHPDVAIQSHPLRSTASSSRVLGAGQSSSGRAGANTTPETQRNSNVDRNTSIRSVMTLPAYRATAANNERVLGIEGERDGVDVIIDLPTAEEEEALRDEEMEAIYQIRLARRTQAAERDEMRRQRREARVRGDNGAVANARTRAATNASNVQELRQEVSRIQEQRQRSVSSVSYADIGVARHDGTRLRANSNESERMGLLSDAASIAVSSLPDSRSPGLHIRERASSLASVDSDLHPLSTSMTPVQSQPTTPRLTTGDLRSSSGRESLEADLGLEPIPPPEYEDVPLDDDDGERTFASLNEPPPGYSNAASPSPALPRAASISPTLSASEAETVAGQQAARGSLQQPDLRAPRLPEIVVETTDEILR